MLLEACLSVLRRVDGPGSGGQPCGYMRASTHTQLYPHMSMPTGFPYSWDPAGPKKKHDVQNWGFEVLSGFNSSRSTVSYTADLPGMYLGAPGTCTWCGSSTCRALCDGIMVLMNSFGEAHDCATSESVDWNFIANSVSHDVWHDVTLNLRTYCRPLYIAAYVVGCHRMLL
jgi:hypothetical protein